MRPSLVASLLACGLGVVCLVGLACSPGAPNLRVYGVSPQQLPSGGTAHLLVIGAGFQQGDTVKLNSIPLSGTVWVDDHLLSVDVPPNLASDQYDVAVLAPDGRQAVKAAALQIGPRAQARTAIVNPPTPLPPRTAAPSTRPSGPSRTATAEPERSASAAPSRQPVAATAAIDISGHWQLIDTITSADAPVQVSPFNDIALQQQGSRVSGAGSGITSLQGFLNGLTLQATYTAFDGTSGTFTWTFSSDGTSFSGSFTSTAPNSGTSRGVRISGAEAQPRTIQLATAQKVQNHGQTKPKHGHDD